MKFKVLIAILFFSNFVFSQQSDSNKVLNFSGTADFVSRYVWRGTDFGNSVAIQPDVELSVKNFTIGAWGSSSINNLSFLETDLFTSYKIWKLKFSCWDYFFMNTDSVKNNYFEYSANKTKHDLSFETEFLLSEEIPLKFLAAYNFYGADSLHSTYLEISYKSNNSPVVLFAGFTTGNGWYGNQSGFVNLGIVVTKECKISDNYSIPFFCKLVINPQKQNLHIVAGITF